LSTAESRVNATALLARAAERSKRGNVAYSRTFVRVLNVPPDIVPPVPPLARLIQGGRGGEARLKLYLLLTMMATRYPYDIRNSPNPQTLALTLDLPPITGPRRISSNMKWLSDHRFIRLTKRPGLTPAIQLLDPYGSGYPLANPRHSRPFVPWMTIPIGFWSRGWLLQLSPVAIAVLFSLREHLGGYETPRYMLRDRRESYYLSHDTWTRGSLELEDNGLLTVTRRLHGQDQYADMRLRNNYWLNIDRLDAPVPN
jgi:hypothetical protein